MERRITWIMFVTIAVFLQGCSGGATPLPTASVTGEVKKMSGEVYGDVTVVFHPSKGPPVTAKTNDAGQFTATVPLGDCKVAIVKQASATSEDTSPEAIAASQKEKPAFNPRFSSPESSGLTVKVEKEQKEKVVFVVE